MSRSKYNVDKNSDKRTHKGIVFDSELEMKYYRDVLCPLISIGAISEVVLQREYELQPKFKRENKTIQPIKYVADFSVEYSDGHEEVIDTKGCPDSVAILKRKMFWYTYPDTDYKWIGFSAIDGGWKSYEYIKKQRALRKKEKAKKKAEEKNDKK